jgi:hypothetical protein
MSLSRRINGNRGLETAPTDDAATFAITSLAADFIAIQHHVAAPSWRGTRGEPRVH